MDSIPCKKDAVMSTELAANSLADLSESKYSDTGPIAIYMAIFHLPGIQSTNRSACTLAGLLMILKLAFALSGVLRTAELVSRKRLPQYVSDSHDSR